MKQVLTYVNPLKRFDAHDETLFKIQVDNSLDLGWSADDIIFLTNFDYEYRSVVSRPVPDRCYCLFLPVNTKLPVIAYYADQLEDGLHWLHDLDAFQQVPFSENDILMGHHEVAFCDFGRMDQPSGGSIFFEKTAQDLFQKAEKVMYARRMIDERAIQKVMEDSEVDYNRVKKLNITFNFLYVNFASCYLMAHKPIKVVHFNPYEGARKIPSLLDFYRGKNGYQAKLLEPRLEKIFNQHGII